MPSIYCRLLQTIVVLTFLGIAPTGCSRPAAEDTTPSPATSPAASNPLGAPEITLKPVDERTLAEAVASCRGQVVLVDFWATWCLPCVEGFPHTVELSRKFADRRLKVISVSLNDPEEQDDVLAFLKKKQATFANYQASYGASPQAFEAFEIDALPYYKIYDRDGKLHRTFSGGGQAVDPEEIRQVVADLLPAS